jgi:peptidoglycan biosynthesis protein MviN/MurJ (putative lipid II flippase)
MVQFEAVTIGALTIPAGVFGSVNIVGIPLGPIGLALGAAVGAWLEWGLLRRQLKRRIGTVGAGASRVARMLGAALAAAAVGHAVRLALAGLHPLPTALLVAASYGVVYFGVARLVGVAEARALVDAATRRLRR